MSPIASLWSTDKIADYFSVEPTTVLKWIKDEQNASGTGLVARKINNRWKATEADVFDYRDRKYAEGAAK